MHEDILLWLEARNEKSWKYLPTSISSLSDAFLLTFCQISHVNKVDALLNTDVREDISAAIIAASKSPEMYNILDSYLLKINKNSEIRITLSEPISENAILISL